MYYFRALLCCIILALSVATVSYDNESHAPVTPFNPIDDPNFADLVRAGYQPPSDYDLMIASLSKQNIQSAHQADYSAALTAYEQDERTASFKASENAATRNILVVCVLVVFLILAITFLPWRRWGDDASKSTNAVAEEAVKLAARGVVAAKALAEPSPIVGRSGLKTYSVADELSKWSKLHDEGVVSHKEFEEARDALLRRGP